MSGLFGTPNAWVDTVRDAAASAGDRVWPMPIYEEAREQLRSEIADMVNSAGRPGGAVTAAAFLREFVGDRPWAHLDIAGTAWAETERAVSAERRDRRRGAAAHGVGLDGRASGSGTEGVTDGRCSCSGGCRRCHRISRNASTPPSTNAINTQRPGDPERGDDHVAEVHFLLRLLDHLDDVRLRLRLHILHYGAAHAG